MAPISDDASKSGWVIRDALPDDEPCLVSMWLKAFAHAPEVRSNGRLNPDGVVFPKANEDGHPDEVAYWRAYHPIVTSLLASGRVRVACPEGRALYTDAGPAIIAGWSCTTPGLVHWVAVKRQIASKHPDDARGLIAELLGEIEPSDRATFDLLDAKKVNALPALRRETDTLSALRVMAQRSLGGDALFARVVGRIMAAKAWTPSSERAA